ncbi:MAG: Hpt domain-containing protein [Gammaproteobacteria bacterium]|nr:Hpt domain-containing protein [Gammaproteobacteria bacterium]
MSQTAMDAAAFSEMKQLMGDSLNDVIELCLQSLPEQVSAIEDAIDNKNAESLFNVSHRMKSACGSIGAFGLAEKAESIEIIGRDGSTQVSDQAINELRDAASQVITFLNNEINRK